MVPSLSFALAVKVTLVFTRILLSSPAFTEGAIFDGGVVDVTVVEFDDSLPPPPPQAVSAKVSSEAEMSDLFDADWYLETYSDVKKERIDPAEHYLLYGAKEGRKPSPLFDGNWYLQANPDVASENTNPLIHYIKFGREEKRPMSPVMITYKKK